MLYDGKGLIEVVQQLAPLLVVLRTAKAHGVVLQAVPFHEQQVGARALQAPRQCQAPETGHTRNDPLGLPEGGLEVILVARSDRQQRMLESHFAMVAAVAVGPAVRGAAPRYVNTPVSQREPCAEADLTPTAATATSAVVTDRGSPCGTLRVPILLWSRCECWDGHRACWAHSHSQGGTMAKAKKKSGNKTKPAAKAKSSEKRKWVDKAKSVKANKADKRIKQLERRLEEAVATVESAAKQMQKCSQGDGEAGDVGRGAAGQGRPRGAPVQGHC